MRVSVTTETDEAVFEFIAEAHRILDEPNQDAFVIVRRLDAARAELRQKIISGCNTLPRVKSN